MTKPRLAIVSTFDDQCGIASYTRCLVKQLQADFDIEVFDLDQSFMRSTTATMSVVADDMIRRFCARAKTFDFVNIQLEYGTLGARPKDIGRRLGWIIDAAPALSVTFHTILDREVFDHRKFTTDLRNLRVADAWSTWTDTRDRNELCAATYRMLRNASKRKPVNVIMHTLRDAQLMRHGQRLPNVFDHPLVFLADDEVRRLRANTTRSDFPSLEHLPADARTVGVFGFISRYKGFDTVVKALRFLPEDYHLLVFGSVHPNDIRKDQQIYPYVQHLLETAAVDTEPSGALSTTGNIHTRSLAQRIHFLGAQTDESFARASCICDTVVMPYIEVGQSASGAISIALEMGARVVASRNKAFLQFSRYFPDCVEMFDIGNYVELAERIQARQSFPASDRIRKYNVDSNRATYRAANGHAV